MLDPAPDLTATPITPQERIFVTQLILHLSTQYEAEQGKMTIRLEGLHADIQETFALPIQASIWNSVKQFQNPEFVRFVAESSR